MFTKMHYRHGSRTLCNQSLAGSLKATTIKKKVTCKTCKSLLRYKARVKRSGRF